MIVNPVRATLKRVILCLTLILGEIGCNTDLAVVSYQARSATVDRSSLMPFPPFTPPLRLRGGSTQITMTRELAPIYPPETAASLGSGVSGGRGAAIGVPIAVAVFALNDVPNSSAFEAKVSHVVGADKNLKQVLASLAPIDSHEVIREIIRQAEVSPTEKGSFEQISQVDADKSADAKLTENAETGATSSMQIELTQVALRPEGSDGEGPYAVYMTAQTKLIGEEGNLLDERAYTYRGTRYMLGVLGSDQGKYLRQSISTGYQMLAESMLSDLRSSTLPGQ